jgi:hypothetical protein
MPMACRPTLTALQVFTTTTCFPGDQMNLMKLAEAIRNAEAAEAAGEHQKALADLLQALDGSVAEQVPTCAVCGKPTVDYYVVQDDVWVAAKLNRTDHAHLACLRVRLQRPFKSSDLTEAPVNTTLRSLQRIETDDWCFLVSEYTAVLVPAVVEEVLSALDDRSDVDVLASQVSRSLVEKLARATADANAKQR